MKTKKEKLIGELQNAKQFLLKNGLNDWVEGIEHHEKLLTASDFSKVMYLWNIFAPTCDWDDLAISITSPTDNKKLVEIGEAVFRATNDLIKELGVDPGEWNLKNV